ncbi:MAG: stage II sporulation protein M [Acidimicrobiia bacterium]
MDLDRFLASHEQEWTRLADLTTQASRRSGAALSGPELDELINLYQRTGAHLSYARRSFRDPALQQRLDLLIASAHATIYGTRPASIRSAGRFFSRTFPGAVWSARWFVLVAAMCTFIPALALGAWIANSDRALEASAPAAVREAYVSENFEEYYSSEPAGQFATRVFVNNVQVSIMAFALGVLGCVVTAALLAYNGMNLGFAAGLFFSAGQQSKFFGLILPHGLLELSAVVVAGAAGLRLGWTVIDPGDRRRSDALAAEGRRSVTIVLGLILAFAVAGAIEGFVTGSGLPTSLRVGVGIAVFVAFWLYIVVQGRIAESEGATGNLEEIDDMSNGQSRPVALSSK